MKRIYSVDLKSHLWYPGNYTTDWNVKIETESKALTEYLEEKVLDAISGFKEYEKEIKE